MIKCFICGEILTTISLEGENGNVICISHANLSEEKMKEIRAAADVFVCPKSLSN